MAKAVLRLKDRTALITGGTSGIGLSIAKRLAQDGAKIIVSSRNQKHVDITVRDLSDEGYDVTGVACHIGKVEERKNLVKELERKEGLDILVQCVGTNLYMGPIIDCPESAWDKTFDLNVKVNLLITRELLPLLKQSKCGRVIYNSSALAYMAYDFMGLYSISKLALNAFTRMIAYDLAKHNITANCIAPALVDTPFGEFLMKRPESHRDINAFNAIKRIAQPAEIAGLVAFLASDESSYITGESICLAGGFPFRL